MKPKIVIDDKIPFIRGVLDQCATTLYLPGAKISPDDVRDADAIITRTRTQCNRALLHNSSVRFIATATIGYDHIDDAYCHDNNITWTSAPGCNSGSVMQYISSAIVNLALKHRLKLKDITLGVVGIGNVGTKVVKAAEALGIRVLRNDPPRQRAEGNDDFCSLDEILANSDIISLHVPLNREGLDTTFHLADENFFRKMRSSAFLINSSRGEVVFSHALKHALKHQIIRGAILDVWENEPDIDLELLDLLNYGTMHIAGYSADGKANGTTMSVQALSRFFNLGLDDWTVQNMPAPADVRINIPDDLSSFEEKIAYAVNRSYDIAFDSENLRRSPDMFEAQRGDYRIRREFHAFELHNSDPALLKTAQGLGFRCV
ncbi:MAG: 4-phosphoerythronate dehydrogenase [Victivallales bacterium]|nr:4-phosphoerythronate dehydrogenase [Victivallales bacterium]